MRFFLISRSGTLCNVKYKNILKYFPCCVQQVHYSVIIHKPVQVFPCVHPKIIVHFPCRFQSNSEGSQEKAKNPAITESSTVNKLSQRTRLKQAVRDYGATIIVFHVAISLASLGICYLAISSGVDAVSLLQRCGFPDYVISSKVAVGGSTFVMAYAVHKLFAPARIAITLSCAPFIVRYLRKINLIKPPPKQ